MHCTSGPLIGVCSVQAYARQEKVHAELRCMTSHFSRLEIACSWQLLLPVCLKLLKVCAMVLQVYSRLASAYAAIAERLSAIEGNFFFGSKPSSLDALLFGHLAFHLAAPVSAPEIREQVVHLYLDNLFIHLYTLSFT